MNEEFYKDEFDIKVDSKKRITTIITLSNRYKTEDNMRVGSNFKDIRLLSDNLKEGEISLSKGSKKKWDFGKTIVYNNILFIDNDEDNLVDAIMISKE